MSDHTALLVVDAQVNQFVDESAVYEADKFLEKLEHIVAQARTADVPIIFIQHNGSTEWDPDRPGTVGWQIHPRLAPLPGEVVVQKHTPDAFHETTLQSELQAQHIENLIVAGMQTDMCINATCRRAQELGYGVTLIKDAHSTMDDGKGSAAQIIDQYNEALQSVIGLVDSQNIRFQSS